MNEASNRWNALPKEERRRLRGIIIERQMLDYQLEIRRAQAAHEKHLREVRKHLQNVEAEYEKWLRETSD